MKGHKFHSLLYQSLCGINLCKLKKTNKITCKTCIKLITQRKINGR